MNRFIQAPFHCIIPFLFFSFGLSAFEGDLGALRKEIGALREELNRSNRAPQATVLVDEALHNKFGPNARVTTRQGRLRIGGLVQVWFHAIQNDQVGWEDTNQILQAIPAGFGSNEVGDNDTFRVRRAQLSFTLDIHENIRAHLMIDPARAADSFPDAPSNQGISTVPGFSGEGCCRPVTFPDVPTVSRSSMVRNGSSSPNRLLEDAYIEYHGFVPHHDFKVGQFQRRLGMEGRRNDAALDFVDRSMVTKIARIRDFGIQVRGTWFDGRLQYWVGGFNGSGTAFQSHANRSDTNDQKDVVASIQGRPVWGDELWGNLELGYSLMYGRGGEAAGHGPTTNPVDGLNRRSTVHVLQYAYAHYAPGGPVRGWWIKGEYGQYRDRFFPGEVATGLVAGTQTLDPAPFHMAGWYVSSGYHLGKSRWADDLKPEFRKLEVAFRYEVFENLVFHDLDQVIREQDFFKTQVYTAGLNYYVKGQNVKLQVNYNWVLEEDHVDVGLRQVREVRNNSLIVALQVSF